MFIDQVLNYLSYVEHYAWAAVWIAACILNVRTWLTLTEPGDRVALKWRIGALASAACCVFLAALSAGGAWTAEIAIARGERCDKPVDVLISFAITLALVGWFAWRPERSRGRA